MLVRNTHLAAKLAAVVLVFFATMSYLLRAETKVQPNDIETVFVSVTGDVNLDCTPNGNEIHLFTIQSLEALGLNIVPDIDDASHAFVVSITVDSFDAPKLCSMALLTYLQELRGTTEIIVPVPYKLHHLNRSGRIDDFVYRYIRSSVAEMIFR